MDYLNLTASDATFYVGLFTDPEGLHPYGTTKAIHIQNATSGSVTFTGLPQNTYYVFETDADGTPIPYDEQAEGRQFYCTILDETQDNLVEINAETRELDGKVNLTNVYSDLPDGYVLYGELTVNKNIFVGDEQTEVDDVFYVGVFSDENLEVADIANTQLVNNGTVQIEIPITGNGKVTDVYWVFETDKEGRKVNGTEGFAYEVSGEAAVSFDTMEHGLIQAVTLTNSLVEEKEEGSYPEETIPQETPIPTMTPIVTATPTKTPTQAQVPTITPAESSVSSAEVQSPNAPNTGDDSNAEWYLFLLAGAFIGMGASIYGKKRREK
jgi:LPXTG-motif cell wall-anchored protein